MDSSLYIVKSMTVLLLIMGLFVGCGPSSGNRRFDGDLAEVNVTRVPSLDYDSFALSLTPKVGTSFSLPRKVYPAADGKLNIKVPVGTYRLILELLKGQKVIASSESCKEALRPESYALKSGLNNLDVPICPTDPQGSWAGSGNGNWAGRGFSLDGDQLIDPSGAPFVMRGINTPHAYYLKQSNDSLTRIKQLGFNTVRIVWCADNLIRAGRCEEKDIHPVEELERSLSLVKAQNIVAMLNLQNATGSDSAEHLQKMVEYLIEPEVKRVLLDYKDYVLINIANEWYGTWDKTKNYIDAYRVAVRDLRKAGLPHVLIVDARGYGQDVSSIVEHGKDLVNLDPNLMISAHLYDVYSTPKSVSNVFSIVRENKLPFVVGEFSCSHGAQKPVACETILTEASRPEKQYGYIGWSYSGNGASLRDLDIVELGDWSTLTPWGRILVNHPSGVTATAKEACYLRSPSTCSGRE